MEKEIVEKTIAEALENNSVVLFMKGSKNFPQCGFSAAVVQMLEVLSIEFKDVNVLESDEMRQQIKEFSDWPTIPQLYVDKKFIGGCDIVREMAESGELEALLKNKNS